MKGWLRFLFWTFAIALGITGAVVGAFALFAGILYCVTSVLLWLQPNLPKDVALPISMLVIFLLAVGGTIAKGIVWPRHRCHGD